jgi:hypothetical protein
VGLAQVGMEEQRHNQVAKPAEAHSVPVVHKFPWRLEEVGDNVARAAAVGTVLW